MGRLVREDARRNTQDENMREMGIRARQEFMRGARDLEMQIENDACMIVIVCTHLHSPPSKALGQYYLEVLYPPSSFSNVCICYTALNM